MTPSFHYPWQKRWWSHTQNCIASNLKLYMRVWTQSIPFSSVSHTEYTCKQADGENQGHYMNLTDASGRSIGNICYDLQLLAESPKQVMSRLSSSSETVSCSDNPLYADQQYQPSEISSDRQSPCSMPSQIWLQCVEVQYLTFACLFTWGGRTRSCALDRNLSLLEGGIQKLITLLGAESNLCLNLGYHWSLTLEDMVASPSRKSSYSIRCHCALGGMRRDTLAELDS